jgi:uncharacterized protein YcbK (DUF882 family)
MGDLSVHFYRHEFVCHCCGSFQLDPKLLEALEALRTLAAVPVVVLCGYRCPEHNRRVGGRPNSQHLHGKAADIRIATLGLQSMYELTLRIPRFAAGGIGVYDRDFLHVDVREHQARWAQVVGHYLDVHALVHEPPGATLANAAAN